MVLPDDDDYSHVVPKDCAACGQPIPLIRLNALPDTVYCVGCTDSRSPRVVHDPEILCAKSSPSGQNGWSAKS